MSMSRQLIGAGVLATAGLCTAGAANAAIYVATFTGTFPATAPSTPVSGSITFDTATLGSLSSLVTILTVNLTIAGHVYTPAEVGYGQTAAGPNNYLFGGQVGGVSVIANFDNHDFYVYRDEFVYVVPGVNTVWRSASPAFSISPIPEPPVAVLALCGGALLCVRRRLGLAPQ